MQLRDLLKGCVYVEAPTTLADRTFRDLTYMMPYVGNCIVAQNGSRSVTISGSQSDTSRPIVARRSWCRGTFSISGRAVSWSSPRSRQLITDCEAIPVRFVQNRRIILRGRTKHHCRKPWNRADPGERGGMGTEPPAPGEGTRAPSRFHLRDRTWWQHDPDHVGQDGHAASRSTSSSSDWRAPRPTLSECDNESAAVGMTFPKPTSAVAIATA